MSQPINFSQYISWLPEWERPLFESLSLLYVPFEIVHLIHSKIDNNNNNSY